MSLKSKKRKVRSSTMDFIREVKSQHCTLVKKRSMLIVVFSKTFGLGFEHIKVNA
jgi:hypothetical protein